MGRSATSADDSRVWSSLAGRGIEICIPLPSRMIHRPSVQISRMLEAYLFGWQPPETQTSLGLTPRLALVDSHHHCSQLGCLILTAKALIDYQSLRPA